MDNCNGVQGFINYTLSNRRNISGGDIKCLCKRCKNKKFLDPNVITMHPLQKKVDREIPVLVCIRRNICFVQYHSRNDDWVSF